MIIISPFFLLFLTSIKKDIQNVGTSFIAFPNTSMSVKNIPLHVVFSTLLSVLGNVARHSLSPLPCFYTCDAADVYFTIIALFETSKFFLLQPTCTSVQSCSNLALIFLPCLPNNFSNSLLMHQIKTKETVKEVWIPGIN